MLGSEMQAPWRELPWQNSDWPKAVDAAHVQIRLHLRQSIFVAPRQLEIAPALFDLDLDLALDLDLD